MRHSPYQKHTVFRSPDDLTVDRLRLGNVILIGACFVDFWKPLIEEAEPGCHCERVMFNHYAVLPETLPLAFTEYDFQVIAIPYRSVVPESVTVPLAYNDIAAYDQMFKESCARLDRLLDAALLYNSDHNILTFVANFLVPMQNSMGRLFPRYDIRNPVHLVEKLNEHLYRNVSARLNCHVVDADQIAATFGKRHVQDDSIVALSHNSLVGDWMCEVDQQRLEPPPRTISQEFEARTKEFIQCVWREIVSSLRTIRSANAVKLVIMDLDDTLWRGVIVDSETQDVGRHVEGWPLGVLEAVSYLKRRGIVLAVVSKNEEHLIRGIWDNFYGVYFGLENFAFLRINWRTKAENVLEIIKTANVLPNAVLLVDDNPIERAAVQSAIPGLRAIGSDPYAIRRILLWSPETQNLTVTDESSRRNEMMRAQEAREVAKSSMSRDDFLASLGTKIRILTIRDESDPHFTRSFELLNKTNQFNTTGDRWTIEDIVRKFRTGSELVAFFVEDKFTRYGLVGVLIVTGYNIDQFVMSCRVLGMDVEVVVLENVIGQLQGRARMPVTASFVETAANFACRDLYARAGFSPHNSGWIIETMEASHAKAEVELA